MWVVDLGALHLPDLPIVALDGRCMPCVVRLAFLALELEVLAVLLLVQLLLLLLPRGGGLGVLPPLAPATPAEDDGDDQEDADDGGGDGDAGRGAGAKARRLAERVVAVVAGREDRHDVGVGRRLGEVYLGDGEVSPLVVDDQVGFLEEGPAEAVLRVVCGAADGEVFGVVRIDGISDFEVEGGVGEHNVCAVGFAGVDLVAELDGEFGVEVG